MLKPLATSGAAKNTMTVTITPRMIERATPDSRCACSSVALCTSAGPTPTCTNMRQNSMTTNAAATKPNSEGLIKRASTAVTPNCRKNWIAVPAVDTVNPDKAFAVRLRGLYALSPRAGGGCDWVTATLRCVARWPHARAHASGTELPTTRPGRHQPRRTCLPGRTSGCVWTMRNFVILTTVLVLAGSDCPIAPRTVSNRPQCPPRS